MAVDVAAVALVFVAAAGVSGVVAAVAAVFEQYSSRKIVVIDEFVGSDWHCFVGEGGCSVSLLLVCFEYLWCFEVADSGSTCEIVVAGEAAVAVGAVVVSGHDYYAYYFGTDLKQE